MTDERIPAPDGWSEADIVPDDAKQSQRNPPTAFEHRRRDVAVHVRTTEPGAGEEVDWEVGVLFGDSENVGEMVPVERSIEDRQTAIERARELMEAFDREGLPTSAAEFDPDALIAAEEEN